ncbi:hypothetical protein C0Q70_19066 [Pomacea canaliculata]|uniref:Uncharacterized protein n=1 Tax=Pomacea canaliculata TaxID=400727 RepID=A0A2T7NI97_POMCA|nr:hypothetical protein C0Q70_19066 [Pomacea canaliculata]
MYSTSALAPATTGRATGWMTSPVVKKPRTTSSDVSLSSDNDLPPRVTSALYPASSTDVSPQTEALDLQTKKTTNARNIGADLKPGAEPSLRVHTTRIRRGTSRLQSTLVQPGKRTEIQNQQVKPASENILCIFQFHSCLDTDLYSNRPVDVDERSTSLPHQHHEPDLLSNGQGTSGPGSSTTVWYCPLVTFHNTVTVRNCCQDNV